MGPALPRFAACPFGVGWLGQVPMKALLKAVAITILISSLSGCLTKRTVTRGGQTVSEGYSFKRPFKSASSD